MCQQDAACCVLQGLLYKGQQQHQQAVGRIALLSGWPCDAVAKAHSIICDTGQQAQQPCHWLAPIQCQLLLLLVVDQEAGNGTGSLRKATVPRLVHTVNQVSELVWGQELHLPQLIQAWGCYKLLHKAASSCCHQLQKNADWCWLLQPRQSLLQSAPNSYQAQCCFDNRSWLVCCTGNVNVIAGSAEVDSQLLYKL
jgi:hypothetical protein